MNDHLIKTNDGSISFWINYRFASLTKEVFKIKVNNVSISNIITVATKYFWEVFGVQLNSSSLSLFTPLWMK